METPKWKKAFKFAGITLFVTLILIFQAFGIYWVWKNTEMRLQQQGINIAVGQIIQAIENQGELKLSTNKGEIILIKKDEAKE